MLKTLPMIVALATIPMAVSVPASADAVSKVTAAPILAFPAETGGPMTPVDGSSVLMRTADGVAFTLDTRGLEPGGVYTAWWVVFNAPEHCAQPYDCVSTDLDNASVEPGMLYASGRVADEHGQANFTAGLTYGALPAGEGQVPKSERAHAIQPAAEIHLVLRDHGEAQTDGAMLTLQLTTFNGGCPDEAGCSNVQASVHDSPEAPAES